LIVSISIVTHNNEKIIKDCLDNIFKNIKNIDFEIIIVDNNSSDNTVEIIENNFKNIKLIQNNNIGFGAAHNIAIKLGTGKYHLVLNPDIIFIENSLKKLINFMDKNYNIGLISPKILLSNGSIQYLCRRLPSLFGFIIIRFMPKLLDKVGGFDENFFMYFEDIDLCRRIQKISRTVFYPYTSVIHLWEGGTRKNFQLLLISIRSAIYYFNKWGWKLF